MSLPEKTHNEKDVRVETTRKLCEVFNENESTRHERVALETLWAWLNE
jgi:hypothetical protein